MAQTDHKALNKIFKSRGLPTYKEYEEFAQPAGFISTGFDDLDKLIYFNEETGELGGIPRNRITEIAAAPAVGKSMLMRSICQREDVKALYIDTEGANTPADCDYIIESLMESVWGIVDDAVDERLYDLIVIDSAANLVPIQELDDDNDPTMSTQMARSKQLTKWMRQLVSKLRGSDCAVVFVNHLKDNVGTIYSEQFTPGGKAIPHAASLRLYLFSPKSKLIKENKEIVGQKIRAKVEKSRFGKRTDEVEFAIYYDQVYNYSADH